MTIISYDVDRVETIEITEHDAKIFFKILNQLGESKLHLVKRICVCSEDQNILKNHEFNSIINISAIKIKTKDLW